MKKSLLLIALLIIAPLAMHFLMVGDNGLVLISFRGKEIKTSVFGALFLLGLLYLTIRLLVHLFRAPRKFGQAVSAQRQSRARRKLNRGLIEMAEGNWKKGEAMLAQGARSGDMPLLNYLNAARAAQLQGEHERRDNWLMLAYEQDEDASTAVLLTQAELQLAHEQYEEALATLRKVDEAGGNNLFAKILMGNIYEKLADWESLYALVPVLKKIKKSQATGEAQRLIEVASRRQLSSAGSEGDLTTVQSIWQNLPVSKRKEAGVVAAYARALCDCEQADEAEKIVKKSLATNWHNELAQLYGTIKTASPKKQLSTAEGWLKKSGDDATLLITAAQLAMRSELWGKARSYLESSLAIQPQAHGYQLYGELLTQLGESDGAAAAFRQGLALMTGGVQLAPALPAPDSTTPEPSTGPVITDESDAMANEDSNKAESDSP